ncbi:hypothetical protein BaRGS_00017039 [Batillaria attramentaria]|uniref:Uncharacterized protein n=1 Tax=Batillaria attramentaria TaxID=370345 RepID=A0ABD0KWU7_9CAEN
MSNPVLEPLEPLKMSDKDNDLFQREGTLSDDGQRAISHTVSASLHAKQRTEDRSDLDFAAPRRRLVERLLEVDRVGTNEVRVHQQALPTCDCPDVTPGMSISASLLQCESPPALLNSGSALRASGGE